MNKPGAVIAKGSSIIIHFESDLSGGGLGFFASYSHVKRKGMVNTFLIMYN